MTEVRIPFSYQREWQDGFGARGWKLDCTIGDAAVIAATAESGACIRTSVFVHDILDHFLCGLPMSGHRNEAVAVLQLSSRTAADPHPDFCQMVDEDLMLGQVNGETLRQFLPDDLLALLPRELSKGNAIIAQLVEHLGREPLRLRLVEWFFEVGQQGAESAEKHYRATGLDYSKRSELGLALQELLQQMDRTALQEAWPQAHGKVVLSQHDCSYHLNSPQHLTFTTPY